MSRASLASSLLIPCPTPYHAPPQTSSNMHAPTHTHHTAHTHRIGSSATRRSAVAMGWLMAAAFGTLAHANGPAIFKDADLKLGEQLIAQNKCAQCHVGKVGGGWQRHLQTGWPHQRSGPAARHGGAVQFHAEHANVSGGSDRSGRRAQPRSLQVHQMSNRMPVPRA